MGEREEQFRVEPLAPALPQFLDKLRLFGGQCAVAGNGVDQLHIQARHFAMPNQLGLEEA